MMLIHEVHVLELRIDVLLLSSAKSVEDRTHVFHSALLIHEFHTVTSYVYLTVIPRARMGSESVAHEAFGLMGY